MGAIIAFELARKLRREGRILPELLIVSGRIAPQLPLRRGSLHDLPELEFRQELRRLEGTPPAVLEHEELMQLFSPMLRADFAVNDTYVYHDEPPLVLPIVAFGGIDDPWVSRGELDAWRAQTAATFTPHPLPGKHFFLQSAEPQLLALLSQILSAREAGR
jgi:medium-chain acyl-[acyl-carrier-protein] hydrolase